MNKRILAPSERYLAIEALKRWRNETQIEIERLDAINGSPSYKKCLQAELDEILALIANFEEGVL